jgi:nicotinamidase-related amidase
VRWVLEGYLQPDPRLHSGAHSVFPSWLPGCSGGVFLDMQVGLMVGPDKPWRGEALLNTLNRLMDKARNAGAPIFLARHIGPVGSPIEPGSPLTELVQELALQGDEIVFEKSRPNAFIQTDLVAQLQQHGCEGVVVTGMKTQYCVDSTLRAARELASMQC